MQAATTCRIDSENQPCKQQGDGVLSSVGSSPQTCRPVDPTPASSFDKGARSVESAADHGDQGTQCVLQARVCAGAPLIRGGCAGQPHLGGVASLGEAQQGVSRLHEGPLRPERSHAADPEGDACRAQGLRAEAPDQPCGQHQSRRSPTTPSPLAIPQRNTGDGGVFWEAPGQDLPGGASGGQAVPSVGLERSQQQRQCRVAACAAGDMGGPGRPPRLTVRFRHEGPCCQVKAQPWDRAGEYLGDRPRAVQDPRERPQPGRAHQEEAGKWPDFTVEELSGQQQRRGDDHRGCGRAVEDHEGHADRDPCAQGGAGEFQRAKAREGAPAGVKFSSFQGPERPPCAREQSHSGSRCSLTPSECRLLDRCSRDFVYNQYKALRDPEHLFLMELACSKESVLTKEVHNQGLRAERCSVWNGFDLSTVAGVRKSLQFVHSERPENLWIATECTAYSPMQNLNQRDEQQKARLHQKRREQRVQHVGALIVAQFAHALGVTVHWEWARRCRAWKWGLFREFQEVCGTHTSVISCCQVNVRDHSGQALLGKEWRIESTSASFAHAVQLPCPGEHCKKQHAQAEGSDVSKTAFYSPEFAKRVVYHMLRDGVHDPEQHNKAKRQRSFQELHGVDWGGCLCSRFREDAPELLCPGCLGMSLETSGVMVAVRKDPKEPFSACEKAKVLKQLHHLHKATGHGSYEHLYKSLEARKADPRVLELAKDFKCSTCEERRRPLPRRLANLEVSTEKCKIVQMDAAHWTPGPGDSRNKCQFMVFVDEASRFAVAKLFRKDGGGHVTANDITAAFHEVWEPCFGLPELVRADPDGACRSKELDLHFQQLGIETDNIPADAHWKISVVERSIQWIKELMTKCAGENPQYSHEAILAQAVRTWNQREPVRGYSPYQWMLGKAPDFEDRMFVPDVHKLPGSLLHHPEGGLKRSESLRRHSEKSFIDWQYSEKLSRAKNSRAKDYNMYMPGDLVYFWRLQGKNRQSNGSGLRHGAYAGPARILAMETKQKDGKVMPGSSVWLIRGLRLVKASIEQLRPATERETVLHELTSTTPDLPWTTTKLAEELGPHDYDDVTKDGALDPEQDPDITEDMEESEPELIPDDSMHEQPPTARVRLSYKRPMGCATGGQVRGSGS